MLHTLPPAGHPLALFEILRSIKASSGQSNFLMDMFPGKVIYFVSSGTSAATLALLGAKSCSHKKEVVLPAYTCPSLAAAVIKAGLKPVLCDLKDFCFELDPQLLASKINDNTLAIIAVHLFGIPENVVKLKRIAESEGVVLIEDAAQGFGNRIDSTSKKYFGQYGDISVLSFGRGKPLSLLNGGAVIVNIPELEAVIQKAHQGLKEPLYRRFFLKYYAFLSLYSIFFHPKAYWFPKSLPWLSLGDTVFSLDFDAEKTGPKVIEFGNIVSKKFSKIRQNRLYLTDIYWEKLERYKGAFDYIPELSGENIALLRFPVIFKDKEARDRALVSLDRNGLGATGSYPVPLNELKGTEEYFKPNEVYPNAKIVSERILTLPLHEYVTPRDIDRMIRLIGKSL